LASASTLQISAAALIWRAVLILVSQGGTQRIFGGRRLLDGSAYYKKYGKISGMLIRFPKKWFLQIQ
jgi:hypothetical protein